MPVHEVAAAGFDAEAEAYDRARPGYPDDALRWLVEHLRIGAAAWVADVAAGTGKLTRLLRPHCAAGGLVAVEPVAGMWQTLRRTAPGVPVAAGTAEALPLGAASLDAVTVAQAFHWFDAHAAFAELARVVRPGGRVGLVWNARDRSEPWVDAAWSIMDRVEKRAPWRDHERWTDAALGTRTGFGPLHAATFRHEQRVSPDDVVDRFRSVSHVAVLPQREQRAVLDEVRGLLATHPDTRGRDEVAIPYRVDASWCERLV